MSDITNPHIKTRSTPQWGTYQRENFQKVNQGQVPLFNTSTSLAFFYAIPRNTI